MVNDTQQIPAGHKQTDVGIIPEDWEVKRLGDIGESIIGLTYSPSDVSRSGLLVHRSSNIQNNKLSYLDNVYVNKKVNEKLILRKKDILICVRNGSRDLIGKSALIMGKSVGETFGAFMSVYRVNENQDYIFYLITSDVIQSQINQSLGATINQITNKTLNDFIAPFPNDPNEATTISKVLFDIDSLISKLDQLIQKKKNIKQGAMQELLTGKRRLPGFSGEWKNKRLGDLLQYEQPTKYIVSSTEYSETNGIPVLTAGKSFILGYSDEENGFFNNLPVIIFDDFTTASKYVDFEFKVKSSAMKMLLPKSKNVSLRFVFEKMQLIDFPLGDHKRRWISEFQDIELLMPEHKEQAAITEILENMHEEVSSLELQRNKYQDLKQGMMQQLLTGKIRLI